VLGGHPPVNRPESAISYPHPLATVLETVVLVTTASAAPEDLAALLAHADAIRARGVRPGIGSLRTAVDELRPRLPASARPLTPAGAADLAMDVIARTDAIPSETAGRRALPTTTALPRSGRRPGAARYVDSPH
jgi:hypothetical protein